MAKRERIGKELRQFVYDRDGNRCLNCGTTDDLTIDHIIPVSEGGVNKPSNLQTLCFPCNEKKGSKMGSKFDMRRNKVSHVQSKVDKYFRPMKSKLRKFKY